MAKIVKEQVKKIRVVQPPQECKFHEWCAYAKDPPPEITLYISGAVMRKIQEHAEELAKADKEAMGLMLGDVCSWAGKVYGLVYDVVSTDLDTTAVSVKFEREAFQKLFSQLDKLKYNYVVVGWYHSHPGHTCFMSKTDVETQKAMFNKPHQHALVIDPVNKEIKTYRLEGAHCIEKPFAVWEPAATLENKNLGEILFGGLLCILMGLLLVHSCLTGYALKSLGAKLFECAFGIAFIAFGAFSVLASCAAKLGA